MGAGMGDDLAPAQDREGNLPLGLNSHHDLVGDTAAARGRGGRTARAHLNRGRLRVRRVDHPPLSKAVFDIAVDRPLVVADEEVVRYSFISDLVGPRSSVL